MTVSTTTSRADYTGNGVTTAFAVPFYFLDDSHLTVLRTQISTGVITTLAITTNYTVSGAGNPAGGTITCVAAPTTDQKISILRNVPLTQLNTYVPNDPFPAASHERALDKLTMEVQQLDEAIDRALTLPPNTAAGTVSTALPTPIANQVIGWNGSASGLQNVNAQTLASIVTSGNTYSDLFSGDGVTTTFALSNNPGSVSNLHVSISGVTQRPNIDYTWVSGTTLTISPAPAAGTNNILVRYNNALPQGVATKDAQTFDTVASVAAAGIDITVNHIRTAGYYVNGDGGGALYKRVTSGSTGASTPRITSNSGAVIWELVYATEINVLQFGAYNNATNAATTTTAIQGAINFVVANGGGCVKLPSGTYDTNAEILIQTSVATPAISGVTITGDGPNKTIIRLTNATQNGFHLNGSYATNSIQHCLISNMTIASPTVTKSAGAAVRLNDTFMTVLERLLIQTQFIGIDLFMSSSAIIRNNRMENLIATTGTGLYWRGGSVAFITDNVIDGATTPNAGFYFLSQASDGARYCQGGVISNNQVLNCRYGLLIEASNNFMDWHFFKQNAWDNCTINCVSVLATSASGYIRGLFFLGEWFSTTKTATGESGFKATTTTGGQIRGLQLIAPIALNNRHHGIHLINVREAAISNPMVSGNSQASSGTYHGIVIDGTSQNVTIGGGFSKQSMNYGNTQGYGILVNSGVSNYTISGVDVSTNVAGGIVDSGSAKNIVGNAGITTNTITGSVTATSFVGSTQDIGTAWQFTTGDAATITLANGANKDFAAGSGLIIVTNSADGKTALYTTGGAIITKVSGDAIYVTGAPAAGQIGIQWTGSAYRLTNNMGASRDLFVGGVKIRNSN